ncbi:hypothetical protein OAH34_02280 [bacterium]|nr:hypothetical protein [bacterium]
MTFLIPRKMAIVILTIAMVTFLSSGAAIHIPVLGQGATTGQSVEIDAALTEVIREYAELFNAGKTSVLASELYLTPVLLVDPEDDRHVILETTSDVETHLKATFSQIKSAGWHHSTIHQQSVEMAGPDMAILSLVFSRNRSDGTTILPGKRSATFFLLKKPLGWRIIMACKEPYKEISDPAAMRERLTQKMRRYIELLNGPSPAQGVAEEIYQFPRISRSFLGERVHKCMLSEPEVLLGLETYLNQLKAKGMAEIRVHGTKIHSVSNNLAFVELISSRVLADGTPIPPADTPFSYIWVRKQSGWKMIATLAHGSAQ